VSAAVTRPVLAAALWFAAQAVAPPPVQPLVSVWYRGTPAGTPVAEELAVIRALGFGGIVWPVLHVDRSESATAIAALAEAAGLKLTMAVTPQAATPQSVLAPAERVDLVASGSNAGVLTALAWRAVAHGARVLAFDGVVAQGTGLENADRSLKPWARAAIDVARQFSSNPRFISSLAPGPGLITTPDLSPALDVVMLDAGRSWVVIATNTSNAVVAATVRLPTGTPYAIWLDLLDGSTLAMNGAAAGPRWDLKLDAHAARVYVIDKIMK
jgi:hypothetical protein